MKLPRSLDELHGLRAARWIRESTAGQYDRYGPAAQRELQDRSIARLGLVDTGLAWEPAHSGATVWRAPAMTAMLEAARAGAFDVLVVAYLARWQRNLRRVLEVLEDSLHPAGVVVWFCDEELLSSHDRHWDALVDEAKAAESWLRKHRRRVAEGLAAKRERLRDPGGQPPYGFRRVERLVEPDPALVPAVRQVFALAVTGLTDREVAEQTTIPLFTVRGILTSPLYVGRLRDGGPARWVPLVEPHTWNRVQELRRRRSTNYGRPADPRRPYALSMLHCAACGLRLTGDTGYYRHRNPCAAFISAKPTRRRGEGTGYRVGWYEGLVDQLLGRMVLDDATIAAVVASVARPTIDHLALARVERGRDEALRRYRTDRDAEALAATMARLDADEARARQPVTPSMSAGDVVDYLRDLPRLWADAPTARVRIAETLFARIEVLGFRRARVRLTDEAIARGFAAVVPKSLSLSVSGRGERSRAYVARLRCRVRVEAYRPQPAVVVASRRAG